MRKGFLMREKCRFWLCLLALLSVFVSGQALAAQDADVIAIASQCSSGGGTPYKIDANNSFDTGGQKNLAAYGTSLSLDARAASAVTLVSQMSTQCIQAAISTINGVMAAFAAVNATDLKMMVVNMAMNVALGIIINLITSACTAVMSAINTVKSDILNLATICLPVPSFGFDFNVGIPSVPPCALNSLLGIPGNTPLHLMGGPSPAMYSPSRFYR